MGLTGSSCESTYEEALQENDILSGKSSKYRIEKFLGDGSFGKVAQCTKLDTKEKVAVRFMRLEGYDMEFLTMELLMSQEIGKLDPDKNNIVKFGECFYYNGFHCLVHEILDISIGTFMLQRNYKPLRICEIQMISQQILVALNALRHIGVVHIDISINNIMLINHQLQPFRVKLIGFGLSLPLGLLPIMRGKWFQSLFYSAPEVILGFELNEAIDIWSLGCVLSLLYFGCKIFPQKDFNMICAIVKTQGQPSDHLLDSGIFTKQFFKKSNSPTSSWKLPDELEAKSEYTEKLKFHPELKHIFKCEDTLAFLRFLKQMLNADPKKRINASEALTSDFICKPNICTGNNPINQGYMSSLRFCFLRLLWQLDELSEEFTSFETSREVGTCINEPLSAEQQRHCCTNDERSPTAEAGTTVPNYRSPSDRGAADRPLGKTGSDGTTTAGTGQKPSDTNKAASLISITHHSDISTVEYTTGFVEVKTRKTYWKRFHKFFTSHQGHDRSLGKTGR